MESNRQFVESKLALLDERIVVTPAEMESQWMRVHRSVHVENPPAQRRFWAIAAAAIITLFVILSPVPRSWAQGVWTRFAMSRTEYIRLDLNRTAPSLLLPNVFPLYPQDELQRWKPVTKEAAAAVAGFELHTLAGPLIPYEPRIQVVAPPPLRRRLTVVEWQADLQRLGRTLPLVPAGIDGAEIVVEPQGRSVWSYYGSCPELIGPWRACAMLIQSRPLTLSLPAGVSVEDFTRFSLELAGIAPGDALRLAAWAGKQPSLFLPLETKSEIHQINVRGEPGTLIVYEPSANGEQAFALDWHESGFDYRLFGRGPERAVAIAESMR